MISIALDGPSGSGKGVLADGIAKRLNIVHLDTGAIFRAIALGFIKNELTNPDENQINEFINQFTVVVRCIDGKQIVYLNGEDVTPFLRQEEVSKLSSKVSAIKVVREKYLKIVEDFAQNHNCIIDGRDITSVVLPNADCKIYLTAREEVRAKRRYKENVEKKIECTYEEVFSNLKERDWRDTHRDIAPLIKTPDSFELDNSDITIEETIDVCYDYIVRKLKQEGKL